MTSNLTKKLYKKSINFVLVMVLLTTVFKPSLVVQVHATTLEDAYVNYDESTNTWIIGTNNVEKKVQLNTNGQFMLTQFKNKNSGRDYIQGIQNSDEFQITVDGTVYSGASTDWIYDSYSTSIQNDNSMLLSVTFHNSVIEVTRNYNVFPNTGVIKEWSEFKNISGSSKSFSFPDIFRQRLMQNDLSDVDFYYMTGGGNFTGSWMLKQVTMTSTYARTFDSMDDPELQTVDGQYYNAIGSKYNGTSVYDELFVLRNRQESEGVWMIFDYLGRWGAKIGNYGTNINMSAYAYLTNKAIEYNETVTLPKATIGVFEGDIDDLGNTVSDYFYRYLWDYYREEYTSGGTWQWRLTPQEDNAFESVNYLRYIGGGLIHIDADWEGIRGDWDPAIDSDDIAAISEYARNHDSKLKLWMPPYHAEPGSDVVNNHHDYLISGQGLSFYGYTLDMSKPLVRTWIKDFLDSKHSEFGDFMLRIDGMPMYPNNGNYNDMLEQSNGYYKILKYWMDTYKGAGLDGCASGGEVATMEAVRYANSMQLTDGAAMHYTGYYTALSKPITKIFDYFTPGGYSPADTCFSSMDPKDEITKENTRKNKELEKYLFKEGLDGRWVKVYRPTLSDSLDSSYIMQLMDGNNEKAVFTWSWYFPYDNQTFTIYPKGLKPTFNYTVRSLYGSVSTLTQTGSYWMTNGINVTSKHPDEMITFNLSQIPGMGGDTQDPTPVSNVKKKTSSYVGRNGVELNWTAGSDNNLLSYYEIFRNGVSVDKVSKGTFYFSTIGSVNDTWEVQSVDGDGNISVKVTASLDSLAASTSTTTPTSTPMTKYESGAGFSSVQGQNNWAYLQQHIAASSDSFMYLINTKYDSVNSRWKGEEDYVLLGNDFFHPGENYNAVNQWFAPRDCRVLIGGTPRKSIAGGDGINVYIRKGNDGSGIPVDFPTIFSQFIPGNDTTGQYHQIITDMKANQSIFFVVNKNGNNYFDGINWDRNIYLGEKHKASEEYSSIQGTNNWYYAYSDTTWNNMTWDEDASYWNGGEEYCRVYDSSQHPGDTYRSVRYWISPSNSTVEISGCAKMYETGGDGVIVTIYKNNTKLWQKTISGNDTTGQTFNILVDVAEEDIISFDVHKNGNNYFDNTVIDPTIYVFK